MGASAWNRLTDSRSFDSEKVSTPFATPCQSGDVCTVMS